MDAWWESLDQAHKAWTQAIAESDLTWKYRQVENGEWNLFEQEEQKKEGTLRDSDRDTGMNLTVSPKSPNLPLPPSPQGGFILTKNEVFVGVVRPLQRMKPPCLKKGDFDRNLVPPFLRGVGGDFEKTPVPPFLRGLGQGCFILL